MMEYNTFKYVRAVVRNEGLHYAFTHYSEFDEVEDESFHTLRLAYLKASKELEEYVTVLANAEDEDELKED